MADLTATYQGNTIAEWTSSGIKTFQTSSKYCENNIILTYKKEDVESNEKTIIGRTISGTYVNDRVTTIGFSAFCYCTSLTTISFPLCTTISGYAFRQCTSLTTASFPLCTTINANAFQNCTRLTSLYLTNSSIATLSNSNAFTSTPIGGYSTTAGKFGSIYVPTSLLASYKAATNWTYFSSRFVGV